MPRWIDSLQLTAQQSRFEIGGSISLNSLELRQAFDKSMVDSLVRLYDVARQLPEADRVWLLQFAEAMIAQRRTKRQQRTRQIAKPVVDDWQVGQ